MRVPIEFPASFESKEPGYLPLGRLCIGPAGRYVVRIAFSPAGYMTISVDQDAIDKGYCHVNPPISEDAIATGFGLKKSPE